MTGDGSTGAAGLDEIRAVMAELPGPDLEAGTGALLRMADLERRGGSFGRLRDQVEWLATWQGRHPPSLRRPRTAVFAGNHGVATHLGQGSQDPAAQAVVERAVAGTAAVNGACTIADADLRVFEMALETPTHDTSQEAAMSEEECGRAIAYGMMAVEQGLDLLCLDALGAGGEVSAGALAHALFGGSPADFSPTPALEDAPDRVADLIGPLVARHRVEGDPFETLRRLGGFEMCAVAGAVIAARLARTPVVLGGYAATAAAGVLFSVDPRALDHCRAAQAPHEGGLSRLTERLGLRPLTDFGSTLGAGTEATLVVPMLRAAVEIHVAMDPPLR